MDTTASGAHAEIIDVIPPLRRYVRAHVRPAEDADDVVQETLTRVMTAQNRLAPGAALAYSIVVARHVIIDQAASAARARDGAHRLVERTEPQRPDDLVLRSEERAALRDALAEVPAEQREILVAHVLQDEPVVTIASDRGSSSGSVAAQLARTRARLRVDYVLALRGVELPTDRCRPVLLALSAGDTRRQEALRAGHHLLTCRTCSEVSQPLLARRSALAAVLPWLGIGPLLELLRRLVRNTPGQAAVATGAATAVGAVIVVAAVRAGGPPAVPDDRAAVARPTPVASATPTGSGRLVRVDDGAALIPPPADLPGLDGDAVRAREVRVLSVAADEGFWIGDEGGRVWVQLRRTGGESPVQVDAGDAVSFTGRVAAHGGGFAVRVGVGADEGAALLDRQGAHLAVDEGDLDVSDR